MPMDMQRTKESSDGCQRRSSSQVDVFKAFLDAMAGERHMVRRASGFLAAPCKWSMECSAAGEWAAWGE